MLDGCSFFMKNPTIQHHIETLKGPLLLFEQKSSLMATIISAKESRYHFRPLFEGHQRRRLFNDLRKLFSNIRQDPTGCSVTNIDETPGQSNNGKRLIFIVQIVSSPPTLTSYRSSCLKNNGH